MKKIIPIIVLITLLWSCTEDGYDAESTGSIYGVITDKATGEPIRTAGVQLNPVGTKTVTGNEGQYEFVGLESGSYSIQVTKTGYADLMGYQITVGGGKPNKGDVQLEKLPAALRIVNDRGEDIEQLDFGQSISDITRSFNIFNDSPQVLEWQITTTASWINNVNPSQGVLNANGTQGVIITIYRDNLLNVGNITMIHVSSNNGNKAISIIAGNEDISNDDYTILTTAGIMVQNADTSSMKIDWGSAKNLCDGSVFSAYSDWRLPTSEELAALYTEKDVIGGFHEQQKSYYWNSSFNGYGHGALDFYTGIHLYPNNNSYARCVRTLP